MLIDLLEWRYWDHQSKEMQYNFDWGTNYQPSHLSYMANTGLLDANGIEIWEGDIVFWRSDLANARLPGDHVEGAKGFRTRFNHNYKPYAARGSVEYKTIKHTKGAQFYFLHDNTHTRLTFLDPCDCEVIGHIHENPELLSAKICKGCQTLRRKEVLTEGRCLLCHMKERGRQRKFTEAKPMGAKIEAIVFDEYVSGVNGEISDVHIKPGDFLFTRTLSISKMKEPPAKPKTIAAFQLAKEEGEGLGHLWEFGDWAEEHQLVPRWKWRSWEGGDLAYWLRCVSSINDLPTIWVETSRNKGFFAYGGQWVIKEGDTWRVADSVEEE